MRQAYMLNRMHVHVHVCVPLIGLLALVVCMHLCLDRGQTCQHAGGLRASLDDEMCACLRVLRMCMNWEILLSCTSSRETRVVQNTFPESHTTKETHSRTSTSLKAQAGGSWSSARTEGRENAAITMLPTTRPTALRRVPDTLPTPGGGSHILDSALEGWDSAERDV